MKRYLSVGILSLSLAAAGHAALFRVEDAGRELLLRTDRYQAAISKNGFVLRISRAGETVLEGANFQYEREGKPQQPTALKSHQLVGEALLLEYDTTSGAVARIEIRPAEAGLRITTWLLSPDGNLTPAFRYRLAPSGLWWGGGFQGWRDPQVFPLNEARIAKDAFLAQGNTQGTPVWYSSKGVAVWVRTPHDFRYSINGKSGPPDGLLTVEMPGVSALTHEIVLESDIAQLVRRIVRSVGYPKTAPPADYFRLPIYTTWVEHKVPVSQAKVLEFAQAIHDNKLPCGVIEIDDKWESLYGDMEFDLSKFPDPKAMVTQLHRLGYRVTLWVHPFVNTDSKTYADERFRPLLVRDLESRPGLISWWNGSAAVWDMTNPAAGREFRSRLQRLQDRYGLDGFKFDGADANLLPQDLRTFRPITTAEYADIYNAETAAHFPWQETRVGVYSQPLGVVQRLIDKHSVWGKENGLAAIVPEAITVSMRGFQFVMPDMIGGNQYDGDKIDSELLVRWAQASALMPLMQFSVGPWHFDERTVRLSREASDLHVKFAPEIVRLAAEAVKTGEPILRPLWYNHPRDPDCRAIADQFMLGEDVVVAPVVVKGAASRRVYLPAGQWKDYKTGRVLEGARWLDNYPAPLDTLPLFVRAGKF